MAEEVQVFGFWGSAYSLRVEVALKLKGIPYQYFEEDLPHNKSDLLLKYNPVHKKVPVLVHNGKPISESLLILEYIDENWRQDYPILPQHPHQRSLARFWAKFIDDKVVGAVVKAAGSRGEEREKGIEEAMIALEEVEKEIKKSYKLFGGDEIGYVDIVGTIIAAWIPAIEQCFGFQLLNKFPNLIKWSERLVNHPIVKQILPPTNHIVAFMQANWKF